MTSSHGRPADRRETVRAALRRVLAEGFFTARELSKRIGISEKDVAGHLEHLARSLRGAGSRLEIEQAKCLVCGFRFRERTRFTTPSRCPRCRDEAIAPPRFHAPASAH